MVALPDIIREAEITADDVLQEARRGFFGQLKDHFTLKQSKEGKAQDNQRVFWNPDASDEPLTRIMATWENRSYVWHIYAKPVSSKRIFCNMNVATWRKHQGTWCKDLIIYWLISSGQGLMLIRWPEAENLYKRRLKHTPPLFLNYQCTWREEGGNNTLGSCYSWLGYLSPRRINHFASDCDTYRLGQLTSRFHNAETQWDDFSGEKEVNHFLFICLHQGTYSERKKLFESNQSFLSNQHSSITRED